MSSCFPDHFSGHAIEYARYRPDYPEALFEWLSGIAPSRRLAWDCATGSGQAAAALARHFARVVATDASPLQIRHARPAPGVLYAVAAAESAPLGSASVALVTVAQALHWFDRERFWSEVARVLLPSGVVAVWFYDLLHVAPEIDEVVQRLYRDVVGPYWPAERRLVEAGYGGLEFPFDEIEAPPFTMEKRWSLADLRGYLGTWSASRRYVEARGEDPILRVERSLAEAWGDSARSRPAYWEVRLRVGRRRDSSGRTDPAPAKP